MNKMEVKPGATMPMDIFGLQRRHHDETVITITDSQPIPKENAMRHDTVLRLKDATSDLSSNSTSQRFQLYMRTRPDDLAAVSQRLGPNASITELVLAVEALDADSTMDPAVMAAQRRYISQSKAMVDRIAKGEAENRAKALAADLLMRLQTPPSKRTTPDYSKVY